MLAEAGSTDRCMACQGIGENGEVRTFGLVFNRKKWCKNCGRIVCAACSNHKLDLGRMGTGGKTLLRVCDDCHGFLTRGAGDVADHANLLCSLLLGFGLDAYVATGTVRIRPRALSSWSMVSDDPCVSNRMTAAPRRAGCALWTATRPPAQPSGPP